VNSIDEVSFDLDIRAVREVSRIENDAVRQSECIIRTWHNLKHARSRLRLLILWYRGSQLICSRPGIIFRCAIA